MAWTDVANLAGPAGDDGHSVLNGSGTPSSGLGADGDFYIDTAAWAIYGPKTSGAWGSATPLRRSVDSPVALTDGTNIATDASAGNTFSVTIAGNRTISIPTNPSDGKMILYRITQDGTGSRTITFTTTGTGCFVFGPDVPAPTLSTGAGKTDYVGFIYMSAVSRWHCLGWTRGF